MTANFFVDIWTGDIVSLTILFFVFLPFVLIGSAISWAKDKWSNQ